MGRIKVGSLELVEFEEKAGAREKLAVVVTTIECSLGGCHREKVTRDSTDCPGSNQHHYVRQQPHRCEVLPTTTRKRESRGKLINKFSKTPFFL